MRSLCARACRLDCPAKPDSEGTLGQVRVWRTARTQQELLLNMRSLDPNFLQDRNLVAYWRFNDPDRCVHHAAHTSFIRIG